MLHGAMELRQVGPLFDAPRYVAKNAAAAARNPLLHFIAGGGTRDRILTEAAIVASGLFDPDWYLLTYPDVAAEGCDPLEHYILHGGMELRHDPCATSRKTLTTPPPPNRFFISSWAAERGGSRY